MVYMTPSELGWRPYKTQWINKFLMGKGQKRENRENEEMKQNEVAVPLVKEAVITQLDELFELYVDEGLLKLQFYNEH